MQDDDHRRLAREVVDEVPQRAVGSQLNVSHAAARVYAGALFDIGHGDGPVGQIYDDLHAV